MRFNWNAMVTNVRIWIELYEPTNATEPQRGNRRQLESFMLPFIGNAQSMHRNNNKFGTIGN